MLYKRLNCGLISSQDIFDKAIDDTIHGVKGVMHIRDDFIVYRETKEHNQALESLVKRFAEWGLMFKSAKCKFCVKEVVLWTEIRRKKS